MNALFWAPLGAAGLHIFEEFVYPGGFAAWYRRYRPDIQDSITTRFLVIINGLLLIICYDVGALGATPSGVALWLLVTALLFGNACWRLLGSFRTRSYSPGVVTGLLLYLPLAVYGYQNFLRSRQASVPTAVLAFALGASYQLGSTALHRWRASPAGSATGGAEPPAPARKA